MKKILVVTILFLIASVFLGRESKASEPRDVWPASNASRSDAGWWEVQAIDTMKYSRDLAREKLHDENFNEIIDFQVARIAELGATHVAVGTPYDEEFVPFLEKWVQAARKHGLSVWFRGNFSGWEGWFGYQSISTEEHREGTVKFIQNHPELFEDGDIFTSCTECENGGPGDPRLTLKVDEFRQFLITEHELANNIFNNMGKVVVTNYFSMNGDVANLVMDKETTEALEGIVVVDHYVSTPEQLVNDVDKYAGNSGGSIVLGEVGAPIPDIHGNLSEEEQAKWLTSALSGLAKNGNLLGLNYWVLTGGSTGLVSEKGEAKQAADVLRAFYKPQRFSLTITNQFGQKVSGGEVRVGSKTFRSGPDGVAEALIVPGINELAISAEGYKSYTLPIEYPAIAKDIILEADRGNLLLRLLDFLRDLIS